MKLKVYTKGDAPEERQILELAKRVEDQGYEVEIFDLEEDDSRMSADIYDIYNSPAVVVTQDDGTLVEIWQGAAPIESELFNYLRS